MELMATATWSEERRERKIEKRKRKEGRLRPRRVRPSAQVCLPELAGDFGNHLLGICTSLLQMEAATVRFLARPAAPHRPIIGPTVAHRLCCGLRRCRAWLDFPHHQFRVLCGHNSIGPCTPMPLKTLGQPLKLFRKGQTALGIAPSGTQMTRGKSASFQPIMRGRCRANGCSFLGPRNDIC